MKHDSRIVAGVIVGALALSIWWKVSVWKECRETNSFLYCVNLMGR